MGGSFFILLITNYKNLIQYYCYVCGIGGILDNKPFILNKKKLKKWNMELERIKKEEYIILDELDKAYKDLEEYI